MKIKWYDITWICDLNLCPLSSRVSTYNRAGDPVESSIVSNDWEAMDFGTSFLFLDIYL